LPVAVPSAIQHASTALFREVREKIKVVFSLTNYSYDLNSEFRSSAKQQDNIKVVMMANTFCKPLCHINLGL
jgi:hypothetical protein